MNNLVLLDPTGALFRPDEVRAELSSIEGVYDLREGDFIGSVLDCEYDQHGASTIIRLGEDFKTIELTGVSDASLAAALELQHRLNRPLRLFDLSYTVDITIRGDESLRELKQLTGNARD